MKRYKKIYVLAAAITLVVALSTSIVFIEYK